MIYYNIYIICGTYYYMYYLFLSYYYLIGCYGGIRPKK